MAHSVHKAITLLRDWIVKIGSSELRAEEGFVRAWTLDPQGFHDSAAQDRTPGGISIGAICICRAGAGPVYEPVAHIFQGTASLVCAGDHIGRHQSA